MVNRKSGLFNDQVIRIKKKILNEESNDPASSFDTKLYERKLVMVTEERKP